MSDPTASTASEAIEASQFTLQVLSPSLNVPQPLFLELPVTTTIKQLRERIRSSIATKPPDNAQRLIHRGRLLTRDSETMLELFGEEQLRSAGHQTLHLVLRDLSETQSSSTPSLSNNQSTNSRSQTPGHQHPQPHHGQPHVRMGFGGSPHPNLAFGFAHPPNQTGPQLPPSRSTQQLLQTQFETMARLGHSSQNQTPAPSSMGHHTTQHWGSPGSLTPGRTGSPFQPAATRTVVREGIGPDGQRWRVTVNEPIVTTSQRTGRASSPLASVRVPTPISAQVRSVPSAGPAGGYDAQNILRAADAGPATRAMADAMRRNASSSSLTSLASHHAQQPIPPGVTTPLIPSRAGSAPGTPDPLRASGRSSNGSLGIQGIQTTSPEVFILSSPSGPRAILVNGNLGTYYSPLLRPMGPPLPPMAFSSAPGLIAQARHVALPQIIQRSPFVSGNQPVAQANLPQAAQQPQVQPPHELQVPGPIRAQFGHGMDNPQIQAIRLAQVWPHLWMIIRLAVFIWWFTSPTSSWSRWFTVISLAIFMFVVNTGALNGWAEQIWVPLRRQLENLMPLAADAQGRQQQPPVAEDAQGGDANGVNPAGPRGPDPADTAARLVQQRRANNANWLLNQARRLERAGILFIASLAPGLAERHIAQVEAEARAERQRQREAQAAAAASAQAEPDGTNDNATAANPEVRGSPHGDHPEHETGLPNSVTEQNADTPTQEDT
ncbi:hypothetical protein F5B22DRAFT_589534 [Xylaria bambusicola]|uniref:uncharacterized protein n=1 Tax=Xylaria bambusicola TaxID=326684 RepID=UPI002008BF96|nr:uncharacterized protein F5B22DRAFT_589534 [Xylaria bambusicola]KAI0525348.1 hypothetical protein F5B22DRAFT_589534 [Xylaria bambusicola]